MNEASKTRKLLFPEETALLKGKGIDIGCGNDPVTPDCQRFDVEDGDANRITNHITDLESYDFVFSAHCLEHMFHPAETITDWWKLVKPGGVMVVIVPDEDLYEQGYWPSLFNPDHKATFTLGKQNSWSPVSHNLIDFAKGLPNGELLTARLQDNHYDRNKLVHATWSHQWVEKFSAFRFEYFVLNKWYKGLAEILCFLLRIPIDQTLGRASAQNIIIVKKVHTTLG